MQLINKYKRHALENVELDIIHYKQYVYVTRFDTFWCKLARTAQLNQLLGDTYLLILQLYSRSMQSKRTKLSNRKF